MKRALTLLIGFIIGLIVVVFFNHASSRDFANYNAILSDPNKYNIFNSVVFNSYALTLAHIPMSALVKYNIFQVVSFSIFIDALLRLIKYDLLKLIICVVVLSPVYLPLYFLVQLKMGLSLALFLSACASKGFSRKATLIFSFVSHFYIFMLFYFSKLNFVKNGINQALILFLGLVAFVVTFPFIDYQLRFFLGHQEQINVLNSVSLVYLLISVLALIGTARRETIFNTNAFAAGGLAIYLTSVQLAFPVLGFRTLELFTAILCIALIVSASNRVLAYLSPLLVLVTFYNAYYYHFNFGLFL